MSKWSITCVIAVLLTACVSDGQYDSNDSEIVLPDKAVEQIIPPASKPNRRRGPEPTPGFKRKMLAANVGRIGYTCSMA
ncbi:hypothetical protein [Moritella sp. JT01]|uniref:hypothetical protein n=1 Tax=Moritella sp. JT01 TaxID=756698 RepID=UPI001D17572E|nr:hypothetical protein [Moritella sp. JT01]